MFDILGIVMYLLNHNNNYYENIKKTLDYMLKDEYAINKNKKNKNTNCQKIH